MDDSHFLGLKSIKTRVMADPFRTERTGVQDTAPGDFQTPASSLLVAFFIFPAGIISSKKILIFMNSSSSIFSFVVYIFIVLSNEVLPNPRP